MALSLPPLAFIDGIGGPEMGLILVIVLVLFGGQKLPEFARGLGKSIREFKKAASGVELEFKRALEEDEQKKYVPPVAQPAPTGAPDPHAAPDYHDDPYHSDPHYGSDGSEAGPASTVSPTSSPPAAADAAASAGLEPPASGLPATDAPKSDVALPVVPPAAPPPPPAPEPKP